MKETKIHIKSGLKKKALFGYVWTTYIARYYACCEVSKVLYRSIDVGSNLKIHFTTMEAN